MKKITFLILGTLLFFGIFAQEIPQKISYQGKLLENGSLVTGTKSIKFTIATWTETQNITVTNGLYSVQLGSITPIPTNIFTDNASVSLQISVEGTTLSPQTEVLSVAYAFKAEKAVDTDNIAGNPVSGTPSTDQVLKWNGTQWIPGTDETGSTLSIPTGVIVMWSGTIASIPVGWSLCNGANGTPDLTDRFIYSVSTSEDPGLTGGSNTYALSTTQLPSHSHSFSTASAGSHTHSFSTSTDGSHTHNLYSLDVGSSGGDWWTGVKSSSSQQSGLMSSAGSHSHSGTTNSNGSHTHSGTTDNTGSGSSIDNRPAYYKLAFIMKI
jgi:hypothetical protein